MEEELLVVEGALDALIYQNEENGYAVVRVDTGAGDPIVAVGCIPQAAPGERLTLHGCWTLHPSYGEQFRAERVERRLPEDVAGLYSYLSSGVLRGVGAATARRLVEHFGADVLRVIESEPARLSEIRGITLQKARLLSESLRLQLSMRRLLDFLGKYALPLPVGVRLLRRFGDAALDAVQGNPYLLAEEGFDVAFSAADGVAADLGIAADDPLRLEAGIKYELAANAANNGHVFLPREKLLAAACALLGAEYGAAARALDALVSRGETMRETAAREDACYPAALYRAETETARRILSLCGAAPDAVPNLDRLIARVEEERGITYAPSQRAAIELAVQHRLFILTGGPGTGKTTSIRAILALFGVLGLETALVAPTGRAAKRMSELCGAEAQTIHRALEAGYSAGEQTFARCEGNPLRADAVVVDEASMVDIRLMHALLSALGEHCRLILVGDAHQLPPVGPGSVLDSLLRSGRIPHLELTEIFRQARESKIVLAAHAVNRGRPPDLQNGPKQDFFFLRPRGRQDAVDTIADLCARRLPENMGVEPNQIQVLSPARKGLTGTFHLNRVLQAALNPPDAGKRECVLGERVFRAGDRVMQSRNNYDLLWTDVSAGLSGAGVFNGDVGHILSIEGAGAEAELLIAFDERSVRYPAALLNDLELAYAMTVHKSQGSEYRAVILALTDVPEVLRSRQVLYTAITRARELMILVGNAETVVQMAENDRRQRRYSGLRWRVANGQP